MTSHTISQFPILATGKSTDAQKIGEEEAGTQTELGQTNSCSNRSFYRCLLGYMAFESQQDWR